MPTTSRTSERALMEAADLELFRRSLQRATERHTGPALDAALEEVGWADALAVEPRLAIGTLFELQGAAPTTSAALDRVLGDALGRGVVEDTAVVLPVLDSSAPPAELRGDRLDVVGVGTAALAHATSAVVVAHGGEADVAVTVPASALDLRPAHGIDPALGLVEVIGHDVPAHGAGEPVDWAAAVGRGQLAVAHELLGASRHMLELARTHALERIQFGRPIGSFQAIRHRLADTLVAIEMADAVVAEAWVDEDPTTIAMAKALAGRSARVTARHCQQVLAGIGFTTEHPLHLSIRRVLVLDQLFGSARTLTRQLGEELLATRRLPAPLPL
jgi:hypothetical protein